MVTLQIYTYELFSFIIQLSILNFPSSKVKTHTKSLSLSISAYLYPLISLYPYFFSSVSSIYILLCSSSKNQLPLFTCTTQLQLGSFLFLLVKMSSKWRKAKLALGLNLCAYIPPETNDMPEKSSDDALLSQNKWSFGSARLSKSFSRSSKVCHN